MLKKAASIVIRVKSGNQFFAGETGFPIAIPGKPGAIMTGIYHPDTEVWETTPLPDFCEIFQHEDRNGVYEQIVHIIYTQKFPEHTYPVLYQDISEKFTAITPLLETEEDVSLKKNKTAFFSK